MTLLFFACSEPVDTGQPAAEPDSDTSDTVSTESADTADTSDTGQDATVPTTPCETWGSPIQTGELEDDDLNEVSGIAPSQLNPGVIWVLEDRGGPPELVALDPAGASLGKLIIDDVENEDWEDLALTTCDEGWCLWIADTGNNTRERTELAVLRVAEPQLDTSKSFEDEVDPEVFPVAFPDDPQDSEALFVTPEGLPVLVTKRDDGTAEMYLAPSLDTSETTELEYVASLTSTNGLDDIGSRTTSADLWPDGTRILLRTYINVWEYRFDGQLETADEGRVSAPYAEEPHGEAVAYDPANRGYWQISEGIGSPIWFTGCADP